MDYSFNTQSDNGQRGTMLRRIFALGCMIYTIAGFGFQFSIQNNYDPYWLRFIMSSMGFSVLVLSYTTNFFKRNFSVSLFIIMLCYNAHYYLLLLMNNFDANYKTSLLVVIMTTTLFIHRSTAYLTYCIINISIYIALMFASGHMEKESFLLGGLIMMVMVFGYMKNFEIHEAFKRLRGNEEQINAVNNNVFYGIFRVNTESRLIYANEQLVKMLGYTLGEDRMVISELRNLLNSKKDITDKMLAKAPIHDQEVKYNRKDGNDFWGQLSLTPVLNEQGNVEFYDGTIIDITDKKKAENELMLFSAAIDHTPTGVVITDRFGIVTYANPYFTKLTGYTVDEVIGSSLEKFGVKEDANNVMMWKKLVSGRIWKGDLNFFSSNGEILTELISVAPIKNEKGHIINFVIVSEDMTERKKTEVELLRAKDEAEASTRAKEQFLSTMSHELRTPMNSVIGISNLMLEENPRTDQIENLNILRHSANNLLAIINDILDLSKIEAGKLDFTNEDFDVRNALLNIKRTHSIQAKNKGLKLELIINSDLPKVLNGDSLRLNQVLNNLVSNAIKFTEEGFVTMEVKTLAETPSAVELMLTVTDTGIGIPMNKMEHIFESFSQANPDTTRKYGGTGLGLAITKKLVEMQGGEITATSTEGNGSTFNIKMTFKKGNSAFRAKRAINIGDYSKLNGVRILLIDDNPINLKVASKFLSKWNTVVDTADNGFDALEMVKANDYQVVLMDIQMPEMNGYEATKAIRAMADKQKASVPVIALTASALSHEKENAFNSGMNDYIAKPFSPTELYAKLVKYTTKKSIAEGK